MDFYDIKNAILIGIGLSFMIGPVFFMLIQTSILKGLKLLLLLTWVLFLGMSLYCDCLLWESPLLERIKDDPRLFFIGGLILIVYGAITYLDKSTKRN